MTSVQANTKISSDETCKCNVFKSAIEKIMLMRIPQDGNLYPFVPVSTDPGKIRRVCTFCRYQAVMRKLLST